MWQSKKLSKLLSILTKLKGELKKWVELASKMVSRGGLEPPTG